MKVENPQYDPIAACVAQALQQYFADLDGETPAGVYDMVLKSVERPLLQAVLDKAGGNQSRAADWLGLNRNTLRKKMKEHGLL
ncbi:MULTISPECIES: Fis family transcriptional regulator [Leeia]|uniref:Putative Fis-like DNA-binding protein n=1 Tax=Leeia aquatica TaxID=2725557 RepID=A0A847S9L7_9NEIS|nr:Fis family transcriptional regulator [Leeia aquatica]NLR76714.1 Fis family transcriptional regulator [Leeia aquatica]